MEENKKNSKLKSVLSTLAFAVVGAGVALAFTHFYGFYTVSGQSMEDTYHEGDKVIIERNRGNSYSRGDIVIFQCSEEDKEHIILIKRIIAVGGDTLDIDFDTGTVKVNGEVLDEPYLKSPTTLDEDGFEYPVTVPDGCYFCMGDNRNESKDSRHSDVGFVPENDIQGKVKWKLPKWL